MIAFHRIMKFFVFSSSPPFSSRSALISAFRASACCSSSFCWASIAYNFLILFSICLSVMVLFSSLGFVWKLSTGRLCGGLRLCGFLCILSGFTDALRYPSGCSSLTVFIIVHVHVYFNWHIQQTCTCIFVYFIYVHILKAML